MRRLEEKLDRMDLMAFRDDKTSFVTRQNVDTASKSEKTRKKVLKNIETKFLEYCVHHLRLFGCLF